MAVGTTFSRISGLGRNIALGYAIGLSALTDTYNIANNTPNIVYELVVGGVLSATLIPVFVERLETDDEASAWRAISAVVTMAALVLAAATVLFYVFAPEAIAFFTTTKDPVKAALQRSVGTTLLRMFVPQILFYGAITVCTALLNTRRRFAVPMFAPILNNLVVIGVLLGFPHVAKSVQLASVRHDPAALRWLGLGTTAGVLAMAIPMVVALIRADAHLRPVFQPTHPAVKRIMALSGWTVGFVVANQVALAVVLRLAYARSGEVAAYQTALVFFLLPHGVFAVSIMTALQPELASRWTRRDLAGFREGVSKGMRTMLVITMPAAAGLLVLAGPVVTLVLQHGRTTPAEAHTTARVLAALALGLPGFSAYLFLARCFQAMQDARTVFYLYLAENAINIVLALALHPLLGATGLGLAYGAAYLAATLIALAVLRRRIDGVDGFLLGRTTVRTLAASVLMALACAAVAGAVGALGGSIGGSGSVGALARVAGGVVVGVGVYLGLARAMRIRELATVLPLPHSWR